MEQRPLEHHDSYVSPEDLPSPMTPEQFQAVFKVNPDDAIREFMDRLGVEEEQE